jgi:hypothetical protein
MLISALFCHWNVKEKYKILSHVSDETQGFDW